MSHELLWPPTPTSGTAVSVSPEPCYKWQAPRFTSVKPYTGFNPFDSPERKTPTCKEGISSTRSFSRPTAPRFRVSNIVPSRSQGSRVAAPPPFILSVFKWRKLGFYEALHGLTLAVQSGYSPSAIVRHVCDDTKITSLYDAKRASALILRLVNMNSHNDASLKDRCTRQIFMAPVAALVPKIMSSILKSIDTFEPFIGAMPPRSVALFSIEANRLRNWCRLAGLLCNKGVISTELIYELIGTLLSRRIDSRVRYQGIRALLECTGPHLCANGRNWAVGSVYFDLLKSRLYGPVVGTSMELWDEICETLWRIQYMRCEALERRMHSLWKKLS